MKKLLFLPLLLIGIILLSGSCATLKVRQLKASLGPQYSHIMGQSTSYMGRLGFQAGVSAGLMDMMSTSLRLRAGANISMQGANYEDDFGNGLMQGTTCLLYLNIPVVARYQLDNGLYGEAGIQPGFLLRAQDRFEGESYDYSDFVNSFDFGIPFGIGYEFQNNFDVGLRIIPGLTNINAGEFAETTDRNFIAALRISYTF